MQIPGGKQTTQLELAVGCDACGVKLATVKVVVEAADPAQLHTITARVRPDSAYSLQATCAPCEALLEAAGSEGYANPPEGVEKWRAQSDARDAKRLDIQIEHGLAKRQETEELAAV